jgi:hypothetical protein
MADSSSLAVASRRQPSTSSNIKAPDVDVVIPSLPPWNQRLAWKARSAAMRSGSVGGEVKLPSVEAIYSLHKTLPTRRVLSCSSSFSSFTLADRKTFPWLHFSCLRPRSGAGNRFGHLAGCATGRCPARRGRRPGRRRLRRSKAKVATDEFPFLFK